MTLIALSIFAGLFTLVSTSELTTNMSFLGVWERHSLVGVETCKMKCVRKVSCRAVLYSPASISCFLTLARAPASPPPGFILIAKETIKVHGKRCTDQCQNGVCIESHSSKNVCGKTYDCVEFLRPPYIPFSSATVNITEGGAIAHYRCHTNYSFFRSKSTQHVLCHGNCTWETPHFKCISTQVDPALLLDAQHIPLPVHFGRGKTVRICGIPRNKESFTINFERKKDLLLHINPRFKVWTVYGFDKRRICFAVCKNGEWKHETKAKVFFFKLNVFFCLSVRRIPGQYQLLDGTGKVRHKVKDYFMRRKAYNLSISEVELISVEMTMTREVST